MHKICSSLRAHLKECCSATDFLMLPGCLSSLPSRSATTVKRGEKSLRKANGRLIVRKPGRAVSAAQLWGSKQPSHSLVRAFFLNGASSGSSSSSLAAAASGGLPLSFLPHLNLYPEVSPCMLSKSAREGER